MPCSTFTDTLEAVSNGSADFAMVPIENSVAGRVADIHRLLPESGLSIVGEHFLRVEHALLALPGVTLNELQTVKSHPQALAQCRGRLRSLGLTSVVTSDTAGAAREVHEKADPTCAAVASTWAGEVYGLSVLASQIEDAPHNTTRFLIMAREGAQQATTNHTITTIVFRLRSVPAALYKALGGFATNGINLTKIESYLLGGSFDAAQFYVDAIGHPEQPSMKNALDELRFFCTDGGVHILGVYPAHPFRAPSSNKPN